MFSKLFSCVSILLLLTAHLVDSAPPTDVVYSLPSYGTPPSPQWSGYLDASDAEPGTMLHYWFAQAERPDFANLPVVLWLNGGPGSTSILGMLQEHGPLLVNKTGGLMRNPYAWTKQANLLVLESPAGVGYSYCSAMQSGGSCSNTDKSTAAAARAALQYFFDHKFPELRANRFYITGESYAGVYVPTLTAQILENAQDINIKGIAVGDPCTDNAAQRFSMDMLWYGHKYGFVPDADYNLLWKNCSRRYPRFLARGYWRRERGRWASSTLSQETPVNDPGLEKLCTAAHRRFLASSSNAFSQEWPLAWINDLTLYGPAAVVPFNQPGSLNYMTAQWMMREDVREALHVQSAPVKHWPGPPEGWTYKSDYAACNAGAQEGTPSMIDFYRKIAPALTTTIVFNGDTDPCVSYEGTRTAIKEVGFSEVPGGQYRPWFFRQDAATLSTLKQKPLLFGPDLSLADAGPQFAGHVVDYDHHLSFVTVHGSGHMVPQFRPQAAERLLHGLLSGELLTPKLPTNEEIADMSEADYAKGLDSWTLHAKDLTDGAQLLV